MKAKQHLIIGLALLSLLAAGQAVMGQGDPIPNQAVMKMIDNGKPEDVLRGSGARVDDSIPGRQTYLIELSATDDWDSIQTALESDSQVVYVEPNYTVELPENFQMSISFPDDEVPPFLDGVQPISFYSQPFLYSLGIEEAQTIATGQGITVAVVDNGVDFDHPLLALRLTSTGYDFIDDDAVPAYEVGSVSSHGTFVSGLIALTAPDSRILPVRAFDGDGVGNTYAIAEAIYYSVDNGAQVINMSFGSHETSRIISQACYAAIAAGASLVAASGNNSSSEPTYPADIPGVIAVSGIDTLDLLASFSNYGDYIDVCSPAVNLYSALAGEYEWGVWSGTSFAAPLVSAACALVLEIRPDYSTFIMEEYIRQTASVNFLWGTLLPPDPAYGFGRIDIGQAVTQSESNEIVEYGDLNGNGEMNAGDIVYLLKFVHLNGPPPTPPGNPDVNCDGVVDSFDIEYFINRVFRHGPRAGGCQ